MCKRQNVVIVDTIVVVVVVGIVPAPAFAVPTIVGDRSIEEMSIEEKFVSRQNEYKTSNKFPACTPATNLGVKR